MGHEISHDWTADEHADLARPYGEHAEVVAVMAEKDLAGATEAEVFILLCDAGGTGMYVEFGAALASGATVYAVGEHNDATVFHFHPNVKRVETVAEVFADLGEGK